MKKIYILSAAAILSAGILGAQQVNPSNPADVAPQFGPVNPNPNPQTAWQVLFNYDITAAGAGVGNAGVVVAGTEIWVAKWASDTISTFSAAGVLTSQFTVPGVTGIRSMTSDGTNIYAGANTSSIYKIDPITHTLVSTITCAAVANVRYCAYEPSLPGFWVGTWATDFALVDMNGQPSADVLATNHGLTATYGLALDNVNPGGPYLWAFHQTGSTNAADLIQVNIATGMQTAVVHDVTADMGTPGDLAGGIHIVMAPALSIIGVLQGSPNRLFAYDITGVVGIPEPAADAAFVTVFPNPANDMVNIQVNRQNNDPMTMKMFDVTGRVVFESTTVGVNNFINMEGFEAGMYTVQVISNETVSTTQVVKN
jgi:hypothetical protein